MTAGHDDLHGYDAYDGHGSPQGYGGDGLDPLMAVLADEPLPEEARADAAFMAGHRAAAEDVALLRRQLGILADTLARPAEPPAPIPLPLSPPRPRARFAHRALVAAVAALVLAGGTGWLVTRAGSGEAGGSLDSGSAKSAGIGGGAAGTYTACARLVVEGDVTSARLIPGAGQHRITLSVTRYYKPDPGSAQAKPELTFVTDDRTDPAPRAGEHILAGFSGREATPDLWLTDGAEIADQRAVILRELAVTAPPGTGTCR